MKTFLIVMLVMHVIGIVVNSRYLAGAYPRTQPVHRSEDLIGLVIRIGMLTWVISLLDVF
ncbi:hypothetical protein ACSFE6_05795 [Pseudomonas baetica]|uniref:hypothetical protein n=1 Tax=Pseudomonas baetica TaxID=674054 RepID=UPI003EEB81CD